MYIHLVNHSLSAMSNEYVLERAHGQETVMIHAADLYLLVFTTLHLEEKL